MAKFERHDDRTTRSELIKGSLRLSLLTAFLLMLTTEQTSALQSLAPGRSASSTLEPGKTSAFTLVLEDGDYVAASLVHAGAISCIVMGPDRKEIQKVSESADATETTLSFAAEGAGDYSLELTNSSLETTTFELSIDAVISLDDRVKPGPAKDPYPSPRIQRLRSELAAGLTTPADFWKSIESEGTPLAEPVGSDGKYQLVTFLWRAKHDTRNVAVIGSFMGAGPLTDYAMQRIASTDIWFLTLKLPAGARFTYRLSPNDPLTFDGPRAVERSVTMQEDPLSLHPLSACPPDTSKFDCSSVGEMPGAPAQPWVTRTTTTPRGRIEKRRIESAIQGIERPLWVYTPATGGEDDGSLPLLVLFDGEDLSGKDDQILTILDNLIAFRMIPKIAAVFVENLPGRRLVDLVANQRFADFLALELTPWMRDHYDVTKDPARTVVGGYSAGGLAAPYVALSHPGTFGNAISGSGAFWWSPEHHGGICGGLCPESRGRAGDTFLDASTEGNWMAKQFIANPKRNIRFYLAAGVFEANTDGSGRSILEPTREFRDVLLAKGYEVHYEQFVSGHDGLNWPGMLADGLMTLLGNVEGKETDSRVGERSLVPHADRF